MLKVDPRYVLHAYIHIQTYINIYPRSHETSSLISLKTPQLVTFRIALISNRWTNKVFNIPCGFRAMCKELHSPLHGGMPCISHDHGHYEALLLYKTTTFWFQLLSWGRGGGCHSRLRSDLRRLLIICTSFSLQWLHHLVYRPCS